MIKNTKELTVIYVKKSTRDMLREEADRTGRRIWAIVDERLSS